MLVIVQSTPERLLQRRHESLPEENEFSLVEIQMLFYAADHLIDG